MHALYDWEINHVQLNLLDSHDMPRAVWIMGEDQSALKLSVLFQMTMPGAPCIYYGDEVGMSSDGDPYCREAFPWHEPDTWDQDLLSFYKQATALRHAHPVLRTGTFTFVHAEGNVAAFQRKLGDTVALVAFNTGTTAETVSLPGAGEYAHAWGGSDSVRAEDGRVTVTIPPRGCVVLVK